MTMTTKTSSLPFPSLHHLSHQFPVKCLHHHLSQLWLFHRDSSTVVIASLTTLSMALGVMLVVMVLIIHGVVEQSFRNNSSLGYNMIVGAKGGRLQLTLNTVYYLSAPVENIPYTYYQEFLGKMKIKMRCIQKSHQV